MGAAYYSTVLEILNSDSTKSLIPTVSTSTRGAAYYSTVLEIINSNSEYQYSSTVLEIKKPLIPTVSTSTKPLIPTEYKTKWNVHKNSTAWQLIENFMWSWYLATGQWFGTLYCGKGMLLVSAIPTAQFQQWVRTKWTQNSISKVHNIESSKFRTLVNTANFES